MTRPAALVVTPLVGLVLLAACSSGHDAAAPAPSAVPSTTGAPSSSAAAQATVASPAATSSPPAALGATGTLLVAPSPEQDLAASDDCRRLVPDTTFSVGECATSTTARGTVTAVVVFVAHGTYVRVYRRDGSKAVEVLEGPRLESACQAYHLALADPAQDGNRKVVVTTTETHPCDSGPVPGLQSYDLVDVPGTVTLHRSLSDGAAGLDAQGHLQDWTHDGTRVVRSSLVYEQGAWRVTGQDGAAEPSPRDRFQGGDRGQVFDGS